MDEPPSRALSSSSWTGVPEETPKSPLSQEWNPPQDRMQLAQAMVACAYLLLGLLLYGLWWFILSLHSPVAPDAASGHVIEFSPGRGSGQKIFVTELESLIGLLLLLASVLAPAVYLIWISERRRKLSLRDIKDQIGVLLIRLRFGIFPSRPPRD